MPASFFSQFNLARLSYRGAFFVYSLLFIALMTPYWLKGEVVAPHNETVETGILDAPKIKSIQNRKFGDFPTSYIPEIASHLKSPRSGWLALWTNQTELGRPLYQISGFSPAYFPSWVMAHITDDPYRFITILSTGTCFLCGIFLLLLCHELKLTPVAAFLVSISTAASPFFMYWLTFPMFLSTWCWSAGIMYGVARMARKQDLQAWSVVAFSSYSLLMTGYPQPIVFNAYFIAGFGAYLAHRCWLSNDLQRLKRYMLRTVSAIFAGGALALPAYLDLAHTAADSTRLSSAPSFFARYLPHLDSLMDAMRFLVLGIFPEAFGNPISPSFPLPYDGLSVTPLVIFLGLLGLALAWRKTWGWWLAVVAVCAFTLNSSIYLFGVAHLGFHLSPINPLGVIILPVAVICGFGADALFQRDITNKTSHALILATLGATAGLLMSVGFAMANHITIVWPTVLLAGTVVALLAAQTDKTRPVLLVVASALIIGYTAFPLMLRQDFKQIATTSPLIEKIRANLPLGSRFAIVPPGISVLPPNLNARLGLASIHSYNNLAPKGYHRLMAELGLDIRGFGLPSNIANPGFSSDSFWMSNIGLVLSPKPETDENLSFLEKNQEIYIYRVVSRMGCCIEVFLDPKNVTSDNILLTDPSGMVANRPRKILDQGDLLELNKLSGRSSLLILSQKYHRDWRARALTSSGWIELTTVPVNGVFQGVLLPDGAGKVQLKFSPFVQYAWVGHVFWLLMIIIFAVKAWRAGAV